MSFKLLLTTAAVVALGLVPSAQRAEGTEPLSKLTTLLAELSRSVSQEPIGTGRSAPVSAGPLPKSVRDAVHGGRLRINANNEVQVYILLTAVNDGNVDHLKAAGVTVEIIDAVRRRVQARVPVSRLRAVAELPVVDAIRLPTYARRRSGQVNTEGDGILLADAVRAQFALDGTGVRVGVVSDGIKGVFATGCTSCGSISDGPIATGDLPPASGVRDAAGVLTSSTGGLVARSFRANGDLEGLPPAGVACSFAGAGAEGTALLEIIHDLAPGAKLSFANGDTDLEFARAVNFLAASNDVVVDDIGFLGLPYDGTSFVSSNTGAALNNPAFPIRAYYTSAGNDADRHYFGRYVDSGVDGLTVNGIGTAGHLHLFQPTSDTSDVLGLGSQPHNLILLPQNGEAEIVLTWDDPFGGSRNNYDLFLVRQSTGQVVASSTDVQSGSQDPVEAIDYVNAGSQDYFRIVVQNVRDSAQPAHLNLFSIKPQCASSGPQPLAPPRHERHNYNTPGRSITAQSDAGGSPVSVVAVGAICSASATAAASTVGSSSESCLDTSSQTIEFFSSRGPTLDGRIKPDIAAIDGVSISGAGGFTKPFFGTSAAVPHVGGIAALVLQSAPCLLNRVGSTIDPAISRGTLRRLVLEHAFSLSGPNPDNTFGAGRPDAVAAVAATLPVVPASRSLTFPGDTPFGVSLSPAQLGFTDPNSCAVTRLSWSGGCGTSPGSVMSCPFGNSVVSVSASNNSVSFSEAVDFSITVTGYDLAVSPGEATVSAGQAATYRLTISPQGGPFTSPVTLACGNLPPQATCSFNPPTVSPGVASANSVLTVSTAATSSETAPMARQPRGWSGGMPFWPKASPVGWTFALLILLCGLRRENRQRRASWLAGALAVASAAVVAPKGLDRFGMPAVSAREEASGFAIFPAILGFGPQTVGTASLPKLVSLTNVGTDPLRLAGVSISAGSDFAQTTNCGSTVAPSATCSVAVTFTPTAAGLRAGSLTFVDDAPGGGSQTVSLSGTGQAVLSETGGTPAGTYNVTVTGVAGGLTQAAQLTLVVE